MGSRFLYKVAANFSPLETENVLPGRDGGTPPEADLAVDNESPNESYSAYGDFIASNSFLVSSRVGYWMQDQETSGVDAEVRFLFRNGVNPDPATIPPTGSSTVPDASFQAVDEDKWERTSGSVDATYFLAAGGDHAIKGGVQYEKIENSVSSGENGNLMTIRWGLADRFGAGVQGSVGSLGVRRFRFEGSAESENLGLFLQDSWQVMDNLTINLGVRTEQEKVPNYPVQAAEFGKYAWEFDFGDKLAPRFGFAYDVLSNQEWKVYGSWGTYYDITKLDLPRQAFGGARWIEYLYPLDTIDWQSLDDSCHTSTNDPNDNPCPGLGAPEQTLDLRHATDPDDAIDPNIKPMEQEEWQLGLDHQLTTNSVIGLRYVNKELVTTIEDIGFLVQVGPNQFEEHYITGNPGLGIVAGDPPGPVPAQPEAIRDYQGITLSFDRRFADNWSLRASYTHSELEGNYSGLASSDEFGRVDPNIERYFDALHNAFDQNGNQVIGPLNTDRPNQVRIQALYRMPWETTVGVNTYWADGTPISEEVMYAGVPFFPYGRGNLGRTEDLTQTDLLLTHPIRFGNYSVELSLNVLNLFDEDALLRVDNRPYLTDLCTVTACDRSQVPQEFFGSVPFDTRTIMGAPNNPSFLQAPANVENNVYQDPREVRVGLKFLF
jgi:hypothetical protein